MSDMFPKTKEMQVLCGLCGKLFDYTLYPDIHIPGDEKLKRKILNKTLFFPKCPHCKEEIKLKPVCMYRNDNKKEFFVVTDSTNEKILNLMKSGDIRLNDVKDDDDIVNLIKGFYKRRLVYDADAFREKILLSDHNFDDRIIELMKLSLSGLLEKENHESVYRIFLEDVDNNMLDFTAIMGKRPPFEYVNAKASMVVYYHFREKFLKKLGRPEEDEYVTTDQNWAKKSGLLKNQDPGFIAPF